MKVRVYWDFPDYDMPNSECFEDIEEPDTASEKQIEYDAKEIAFEHFDWSYERIDRYTLRVYFEYPDFVTQEDNNYEDLTIEGNETDAELEEIARNAIGDHFEWSYDIIKK